MKNLMGNESELVSPLTTTCAISAYHHWCEFESRSGRGVQHYVIKFVSCDRSVVYSGFLHQKKWSPRSLQNQESLNRHVQNVQNFLSTCSVLFRICSEYSVLFRICSVMFSIVQNLFSNVQYYSESVQYTFSNVKTLFRLYFH
jgi:hypothetical protein